MASLSPRYPVPVSPFLNFLIMGSRSTDSRISSTEGSSRRTFDDGDSFYELYNRLSPSYKKQLDPYLEYNYKNGLIDRVGNFLGFNTAEDRYRMDMQDRARQMLASLTNDEFQNTYNSEQARASRMHDAGLNPDISGETSGEDAAGMEQPLSPVDPSLFSLENSAPLLMNVGSLFGDAAAGLQSVGTFTKLLADIRKTRSETAAVQISNANDAWDYAGKYLSAFDPKTRIDYADIETNPTFFQDVIVPAKIEAIRERLPGMSEETYKLIERQMKARAKDPAIMDAYYKAYKSATQSRTEKLAAEEVHGSLDLADDVVRNQNSIILDHQIKALKFQIEGNAIASEYNLKKEQNNLDFEEFKRVHKLPEQLAETELAGYLSARAKAYADKLRAEKTRDWLNYLGTLRESGDPAGIYLLNAMLQGGYAPLMGTSVNAGVGLFKGGGSWQNFITPGMRLPQNGFTDGIKSTYDPNNPFSWQDQKY